MIEYNSIENALYDRCFFKEFDLNDVGFKANFRTFWYEVAKGYDISVELRYKSDEIEISGFANRMCSYKRTGKFTEQEVISYIDECALLLKNMIVRKRITDIDKDFKE